MLSSFIGMMLTPQFGATPLPIAARDDASAVESPGQALAPALTKSVGQFLARKDNLDRPLSSACLVGPRSLRAAPADDRPVGIAPGLVAAARGRTADARNQPLHDLRTKGRAKEQPMPAQSVGRAEDALVDPSEGRGIGIVVKAAQREQLKP